MSIVMYGLKEEVLFGGNVGAQGMIGWQLYKDGILILDTTVHTLLNDWTLGKWRYYLYETPNGFVLFRERIDNTFAFEYRTGKDRDRLLSEGFTQLARER